MHRIELKYTEKNPHSGEHKTELVIERDGSIEHFVDAFNAFLGACGFHTKVEVVE